MGGVGDGSVWLESWGSVWLVWYPVFGLVNDDLVSDDLVGVLIFGVLPGYSPGHAIPGSSRASHSLPYNEGRPVIKWKCCNCGRDIACE